MRRIGSTQDTQAVSVFNLPHIFVNELVLELFNLFSMRFEINSGTVVRTVRREPFIHDIHSVVVGYENGLFKQETEGWHFGYEDIGVLV